VLHQLPAIAPRGDRDNAQAKFAGSRKPPPLIRGSERILLVDDEPAVMEMGTALMESLGYRVTSQTDSVKALEVFRSSADEFDLEFTDYTRTRRAGFGRGSLADQDWHAVRALHRI